MSRLLFICRCCRMCLLLVACCVLFVVVVCCSCDDSARLSIFVASVFGLASLFSCKISVVTAAGQHVVPSLRAMALY